jgi:hypothetical protein
MYDTQETRAESMIDMNQDNLNRIKHLEKKVLPLKKEDFYTYEHI